MEIILAREMGFCFGVRRAVDLMEEATEEPDEPMEVTPTASNGVVWIPVVNPVEQYDDRPASQQPTMQARMERDSPKEQGE